MKKILIATHGKLASGLKSSICMLAGDQFHIQTIDAYTEDNQGDFSHEVLEFISSFTKEDEGVIFTDLMGGSVNQKICQLCLDKPSQLHIITGTNLMCVLGVLLESRPLTKDVLIEIIESSQVSLVEMNTHVTYEDLNDEQDFLS